jgi:osmoprotectant transport system permease protein
VRLLIMRPVLLAILIGALWIRVHSSQLDFSEQQKLNRDVLTTAVGEHIVLSLVATALIVSIAVPLGILLSRPSARWITPGALAMANVGQAFPTVGLVTLLAFAFGFGKTTAIVAITVSGVLPTLHNTITGLRAVDPAIVQAARGMGMRARQALVRVELPLAVPVILAGVRTTTVLAVGMATLAAFIDGGGLGSLILAGEKMQRTSVLLTGALLTTVLAFALDWLARLVEELVRPRGL